ncbi:SpoIVB peptidase [Brotaphodocola catenula]|uniref:SpoIVB peptidase n=1 Tax=Brotaphodocola catenula TaxID=2885361 RepID=A0AAE3AQQ4_9FIRM|nr:SpoIVB peptidase [Brotaphodocola catenula]MCC2163542.1 SpoIVB peptidase [Brotaphodocola catenula]
MNSEKSTPDTHNTQNIKSPHCQPSQKLCKANPRFRHLLFRTFWISLLFSIGFIWYTFDRQIPDRVSLTRNETGFFSFGGLPLEVTLLDDTSEVSLRNASNIPENSVRISSDSPLSLSATKSGTYQLGLKLFGAIRLKNIQLNVIEQRYAIPCGFPIGIYLKSDGILVVGTGTVTDETGKEIEPALGILESGDYIEAINGHPLTSKEALITELRHVGGAENVFLKIRRDDKELEVSVRPVRTSDGTCMLGAWVRDDTQGIGTMTYLEPNGSFGALGHGISDSDTGHLMESHEGSLYETEILGIEKGSIGNPGIMAGVIYYGPGCLLGEIHANTETGIFGNANEALRSRTLSSAIPVGYCQDIEKGPALLRSNVSGQIRDYEIEIQKIELKPLQKNKSMVIHITDPELLKLTGGIVQGMSGSPIIQNGKLIGAVTHVFVQDSTRGYGIFIETMLEADDSGSQ